MKIKFIVLIITFCVTIYSTGFAQLKTYQFEQIDSLQKIEKRTVVIFIHTDWCKYCQAMKNITLSNQKNIEQLNTKFYYIDFNAEDRRSIFFNKKKFVFKPTGINIGTHQLAEELATINKKLNYPTLCFMNSNMEIIYQQTEYISPKKLQVFLKRI